MDLATFGADGTSELMSRFTYDMESRSSGVTDFFGKLVREPLKMLTCLAGAAWVCWPLLVLSLLVLVVVYWVAVGVLVRRSEGGGSQMVMLGLWLEDGLLLRGDDSAHDGAACP